MEEHVHSENCTHDHDHLRGETKDFVHIDAAAALEEHARDLKDARRRMRNKRKSTLDKTHIKARNKRERKLARNGATAKQLLSSRGVSTSRSYSRRHIRRAAVKHLKQLRVAMAKKEREDAKANKAQAEVMLKQAQEMALGHRTDLELPRDRK